MSGESSDSSSAESAAGAAAQRPAEAGSVSTDAMGFGAGPSGSGGAGIVDVEVDVGAFAGRELIRTATMAVVAKDLPAARTKVAALMDQFGGAIATESTTVDGARGGTGDEQTMRLGLQVPTARFDATLTALATLGAVRERSIQTEDVTAEVADVDSRVESARAALERIRALLTRASSLGTVIRLEGVLSNRQADLEALVAQQRALAAQTQLARVQLELRTPAPQEEPAAAEDELTGFVDGVQEGWSAFGKVVVAVTSVVGVLLPFAVVVAVLAVPVLLWRRRRGTLGSGPVSPPAT